MSSETRPEASSQTLALERIDSAPFQSRQRIEEEPVADAPKRGELAVEAEKQRVAEMVRRVREVAKSVRAKRVADVIASNDETLHAPAGSPEALPEEAVPQAVAQASTEIPAPWEIERKLKLATGLQPTTEHAFARWRDALWEALHGRWSEAGWEFARGAFHLLTHAGTWRRVGKAVLHFLARFIPGREPAVLRRSRETKELFRDLHEEPKQAGSWSNCPK